MAYPYSVANVLAQVWFACWGIGFLLGAAGYVTYIVKFGIRGFAREMQANSLPGASRLILCCAVLGVTGGILALIGIALLVAR